MVFNYLFLTVLLMILKSYCQRLRGFIAVKCYIHFVEIKQIINDNKHGH